MNGKLKAILLLAAMYGLGMASGVLWHEHREHDRFFEPHGPFAERRIKKLSNQLRLSPAQEQTVRDIFEKAHTRASEINKNVRLDISNLHRDSVQAIRQVLTPEQAREFDKIHEKYHTRHKHMPADDLKP